MKHPLIAIAAGIVVAVFQSAAIAGLDKESAHEELKQHGCLMCHAVDRKKVGPAYKDVAVKFKGKSLKEAVAEMKSKPPHASVLKKTSDHDLDMMIEWIMSLSK